ncbi:MAG: exopolyphosphatase [Bacteroidia bacterium]
MNAVIDLGTNTFNLLIGDKLQTHNQILVSLEEPVMLGKGGIQHNKITSEAFDRAFKVLEKFKSQMNHYPIHQTKAFATSAIRNAINGPEFMQEVAKRFQIQIEAISGDLEATYIYEGVKRSFDFQSKTYLIMDIGGGSVEFIIANEELSFWKRSFEIGAIRLHEKFKKNDPISLQEIHDIKSYLKQELILLFEEIKKHEIAGIIGSAGSFESMWQIIEGDYSSACISLSQHAKEVHEKDIKYFLNHLIQSSLEERKQIKNLVEFRREYIVVACILIELIREESQLKRLICSDYALKEGVFFHS